MADSHRSASLDAAVSQVMDYIADTGRIAPATGRDDIAEEFRVSTPDGITVVASPDEIISIDIAQPIRLRPAELAEAVRQAVNEATALAREAVLAGTEDMPGMAQVQSEVARMQRDVLAGYKADMDRITARLEEL